MSTTHPDPSFDSGRNHVKPMLFALAICVATVAAALVFTGLPH